jgi:hypothetical protein
MKAGAKNERIAEFECQLVRIPLKSGYILPLAGKNA